MGTLMISKHSTANSSCSSYCHINEKVNGDEENAISETFGCMAVRCRQEKRDPRHGPRVEDGSADDEAAAEGGGDAIRPDHHLVHLRDLLQRRFAIPAPDGQTKEANYDQADTILLCH